MTRATAIYHAELAAKLIREGRSHSAREELRTALAALPVDPLDVVAELIAEVEATSHDLKFELHCTERFAQEVWRWLGCFGPAPLAGSSLTLHGKNTTVVPYPGLPGSGLRSQVWAVVA